MDPAEEFERCLRIVGARAERTARRAAEPTLELAAPGPIELVAGTPAHELSIALGLAPDESELLWSIVARAVEPAIAANARLVFGLDARFGICIGHHIAWTELPAERSRALLAILDSRHRLRSAGIIVPIGDEPFDVLTPWTVSRTSSAPCREQLGAHARRTPDRLSRTLAARVHRHRHDRECDREERAHRLLSDRVRRHRRGGRRRAPGPGSCRAPRRSGTPGIGVFLVFGRIGCFSVACCHGTLGRGVTYGPPHVDAGFWRRWSGRPLWPVQLIESGGSAILVAIAIACSSTPGTAAAIFILGYAPVRFAIELVRGALRPYALGLSEARGLLWRPRSHVHCGNATS
jgi:hypothetical protein